MHLPIFVAAFILSSAAYAQTITITNAIERDGMVEITIETDIAGPIEVMAGVDLLGQEDGDVFIGASERLKIDQSPQTVTIPIMEQDGSLIPTGEYEATVSFYPWWGADDAPAETKALTEEIEATLAISIDGSGEAAEDVQASMNADAQMREYLWNIEPKQRFDAAELAERLGASERVEVKNRGVAIVGWYFEKPDVTVFQNTNNGEIATWREGKQDEL